MAGIAGSSASVSEALEEDFGEQPSAVLPGPVAALARVADRPRLHDALVRDEKVLVETDHRVEWQHGGSTSERNGEVVCRFHNLWKTNHPGRWRAVRAADDRRRGPPPARA